MAISVSQKMTVQISTVVSEWRYSVLSYPISSVCPTDMCKTENKRYWKQKTTDKWLFIETEW